MQNRARAEPLQRVAPLEPLAEIDRVVVAVGIPESHEQPPGDVATEGVDQLLAQQPHRRRAENHDALLVQSDDTEIGRKSRSSANCSRSSSGCDGFTMATDSMAKARQRQVWLRPPRTTEGAPCTDALGAGTTSPLDMSLTIATRQSQVVKPNLRTFDGFWPCGSEVSVRLERTGTSLRGLCRSSDVCRDPKTTPT